MFFPSSDQPGFSQRSLLVATLKRISCLEDHTSRLNIILLLEFFVFRSFALLDFVLLAFILHKPALRQRPRFQVDIFFFGLAFGLASPHKGRHCIFLAFSPRVAKGLPRFYVKP